MAELDFDHLAVAGGLVQRLGHGQALVPVGFLVRVLDLGPLVADVPEVAVLAVDLGFGDGHGHAVGLGVVDGALAVPQLEARVLPRGDDLQVGGQGHVGQLEADLVVALAGGPVADRVGPGLAGRLDLLGGDQRPGDARAQQVVLLVDGVGPQHREAVPLGELPPQVGDDHLVGPALVRLGLDVLELVPLAQLGGEGDQLHAGVPLLEPGQDDRRVQPAGVGQDDLFGGGRGGGGHGRTSEGVGGKRPAVYGPAGVRRPGRAYGPSLDGRIFGRRVKPATGMRGGRSPWGIRSGGESCGRHGDGGGGSGWRR